MAVLVATIRAGHGLGDSFGDGSNVPVLFTRDDWFGK